MDAARGGQIEAGACSLGTGSADGASTAKLDRVVRYGRIEYKKLLDRMMAK